MALKKGTEVATIDCVLCVIKTVETTPQEIALDTANKIAVAIQTETTAAVKNIVKGVLLAQKPEETTVTGNQITMTDNVFNFELAAILQGGTITYDTEDTTKAIGYTPPAIGSADEGKVFSLEVYSAIYTTGSLIDGYQKITYPNCQGTPFGISSEDGVFSVPEYVVNSAPNSGEAPFTLTTVDELPTVS